VSQTEWVVIRLRMQDAQKVIAESKAVGGSIRYMGEESNFTEGAWHYLGGRGFWLNQIFFTIRRVVYSLTLALVALGGAAIVVGFQFNSMMEQQALAFKIFTGSAAGARKEVQFLFDLAAHGPFEFTQVIQGARQLQAFGFTVKETNQLLVSLQDAMAGMGLDQAALDRATLALGQIHSAGRLLGQDLRQLEQLGLVSPEDLARRLGIQQSQLANIGQFNIPSKRAIDAIEAYWKERFHGAAADFQKTWSGEMSTLHDYGRVLFASMVEPLQHRLEDRLPVVITAIQKATEGFKAGGMEGFFESLDRSMHGATNLQLVWVRLRDALEPLGLTILLIAGDFAHAFRVLGIGTKVLAPLDFILGAIYKTVKFLNPLIATLITLWIAERSAILLLTAVTKLKWFWDVALAGIERIRVFWESLIFLWLARNFVMQWLVTEATIAAFAAQVLLVRGLRMAAAGWEMLTLAMEANPFVFVATVILLVAASLVILYFKWRWFHNFVNSSIQFIIDHWRLLLAVFTGGNSELVLALVQPYKTMERIVGILKTMVDWAKKVVYWFGKIHLPHVGGFNMGSLNPLHWLASGGDIVRGGFFGVGEAGPEIVALPAGSSVRPVQSIPVGGIIGGSGAALLNLAIPLYLDGKKIAESNETIRLDKLARK
jgi:tape measure domain-containing protein